MSISLRKILCTSLLVATGWCSLAQSPQTISAAKIRPIQGKVGLTDSDNPAIGATILVKGKNKGTIVDIDGNFTIDVSSGDTLECSFIGYEKELIPIKNQSQLMFHLVPASKQLDAVEIISVGYGKMDRTKLTGSVASISGKDLGTNTISFDNALTGKMAGVLVNTSSGQPGSATAITIRGISTLQKDGNNPLVVVDGVPIYSSGGSLNRNDYEDRRSVPGATLGTRSVSNSFDRSTEFERNPLSSINPADIASIEVLKDAYATAIYGSRGAAGVILVTTKSGQRGKSEINISYRIGVSEPLGKYDMLSGPEYGRLYTDYYGYINRNLPGAPYEFDTLTHVNWQEEVLRPAVFQNLNLSMSGGSKKSKYYTSLSILKSPSYIKNNDFERYSARVNYEYELHNKVTMGTNFQLSYTNNSALNSGTIYGEALLKAPNVPIYNADGVYEWDSGKFTDYNQLGQLDNNPVAKANENINYLKDFRTIGSIYLEVRPVEWLALRSEIGLDVLNSDAYSREKDRPQVQGGSAVQSTSSNFKTVMNNTITMNKTFGRHDFNAVIGQSFETSKENRNRITGADFFDDDLLSIGASLAPRVETSEFNEWALDSYFGRVNYIYDSRYIAGFTYRIDGSSKFAKNHQYVGFPSFSVGWVASEESFLKGVSWMDRLKFRGSLGFSGINGSGETYYGSQGVFNLNAQSFTYGNLRSLEVSVPVNPNLKWEKTRSYDFGVDVSGLGGLIDLTVDYYYKLTSDVLFSSALASYKGYSSVQQNIGEIENSGIEILLAVNYSRGNFRWNGSFNIAQNVNKLLKLNFEGEAAGDAALNYKYFKVGEPVSQYYLDQWAGVNPETGDPQWLDENGEITQIPTQDDRKAYGSQLPKWFGGLNNTLGYKNFTLTASFNYSIGGQLLNGSRASLLTYTLPDATNLSREILEAWEQEGDITDVPALGNSGVTSGTDYISRPNSSRFLEDNSFVRLKTIKLAYTLPSSLLSKISLRNVECYVEGTNIWTWTRYSGIDPEITIGGSSALVAGVDDLTMPLVKSWSIGINISL
ncbi:MAG: TonB-dependent receptor [Reichenbachiella sp.]|uniref:SusC/RagA family TonB-linked outer membrane protein n=1 Tax=Reichenbachiella sp. TaxID=2184521 RepID=UPI003263ED6B